VEEGGGSLAVEEERNRVDVNRAKKGRVELGWLMVEEGRKQAWENQTTDRDE
jgi:hypothetical protein